MAGRRGNIFLTKQQTTRKTSKQTNKQTNKKQTKTGRWVGKERTGKEKSNTRRLQGRIQSACSTDESLFTGPKSHSYQPQNSVAFSQDTVPKPPCGGERWHSFQKMNILRWLVFIFAKQVRGWYVMESYVTSWLQCWCCSYYPDVLVYSPRKLAKSFLCCLSGVALKGTSFWNVVWPSDVRLASGRIWSVEELGSARRSHITVSIAWKRERKRGFFLDRTVVNTGTASKATLGKLLRDRMERVWAFPNA